nr:carboxylesterase family protein [Sphingobium sp. EP60837]
MVDGVESFKAIPYAAPPLGDLRWRAPQPAIAWRGTRDGSAFGHDCMQRTNSVFAKGTAEPREDCLFVNVFRLRDRAPGPIPVMVYIHGGGFTQGGSSPIVYDGSELTRHGVIVVTLNYRLGRFGFFAHPALAAEHAEEPKGNYGFLDQIAALKWVKRNISAFGGDPNNITIFGQSAGAASVVAMLASPLSEGLFQKAIIQSGPYRRISGRRLTVPSGREVPLEAYGRAFARSMQIDGSDQTALAKLRALPAEALADLNPLPPLPNDDAPLGGWGGPVLDGKVLPIVDPDYFSTGRFHRVPIMIGANTDDAPIAVKSGDPYAKFGPLSAQAELAYDPNQTGNHDSVSHKITMDAIMLEPARYIADAFSSAGVPVYEYRFGYLTEGLAERWAAGAPHGAELAYIFDNLTRYYGPVASPRDYRVAKSMSSYWTNFAKTGDPNGPGLAQWPSYNRERDEILQFHADGSIDAGPDPLKQRLDLTKKAADR